MDKSLPNLSFETIGSARQAASSALTSAFNSVVTQPVNTLKNNITSNSNNYNNDSALNNENTSPESEPSAKSSKFFQVINLTKAANIISSLPATSNSSRTKHQLKSTHSIDVTSSGHSSVAASLTHRASTVLNRINPFEQSVDAHATQSPHTPSSATANTTANLRKFLFSAAASFSIDLQADRLNTSSFDDTSNDDNLLLAEHNLYEQDEEEDQEEDFSEEMLENSENGNTSLNRARTSSMKQRKSQQKPTGTVEYLVAENDTIEKIALKWNTIPSEIQHLNRLVTRTIFPGQLIYVPDPDYVPPPVSEQPKTPPPLTKQLSLNDIEKTPSIQNQNNPTNTSSSGGFSFLRWKTNSKPGHVEQQKADVKEERRGSLGRHMLSEEEAKKLDEECMQRFLKINCKIVTRSKGCYDGVLIITPSAIMFDPFDVSAAASSVNVHGDESSSSELQQASHKTRTASTSSNGNSIYDEASAIIPIEVISNVIMYEDLALKEVQEYFDYQENKEFLIQNSIKDSVPKTSESKLETSTTADDANTKSKDRRKSSSSSHRVTFNLNNEMSVEPGETSVQETPVVVDQTKQSDTLSVANETNSNNNINVESKEEEDKSEKKKPEDLEEPECELKPNSDMISCYLCIKVNHNKDFIYCPLDRKMKNKLRSEFWFQIYDNSTDKIFAFFLEWKSDNHYALNPEEGQKKAKRFQVVKPHENLTDLIDQSLKADLHKNYSSTNRLLNKFDTFTKDWEMVNLQELELKLKTEKEIEKEYKTLPTLMNESLILKEEHLRKLNVNLIARAIGYNWILSFSTEEHGFSLSTMYRKLADVDTPCLVVVLDTNNNVFGAMSSTKLYQSEHFYGTGESFLFTFTPAFRVFKWTGENNFFTRGQAESIAFGCSDGHHGLWFDGDLLNGHTQKCQTYDNDLLTTQENFTIASLEVWSFSDE